MGIFAYAQNVIETRIGLAAEGCEERELFRLVRLIIHSQSLRAQTQFSSTGNWMVDDCSIDINWIAAIAAIATLTLRSHRALARF